MLNHRRLSVLLSGGLLATLGGCSSDTEHTDRPDTEGDVAQTTAGTGLPSTSFDIPDMTSGGGSEGGSGTENMAADSSSEALGHGSDSSSGTFGDTEGHAESSDSGVASTSETTGGTDAQPWCGDGVVDPTEVCDDGDNDGRYQGCMPGCGAWGPFCGDGQIQPDDETCDEGGVAVEGCNGVCQVPGTRLATVDALVPELRALAYYGPRVTVWNDRVTVLFGDRSTSLWELDREARSTVALRRLPFEISNAVGVGLARGTLLVAGSTQEGRKLAVQVDEDLEIVWTYEDAPEDLLPEVRSDRFVGVVPFEDGALLAASYQGGVGSSERSASVATRIDGSGMTRWQAVEFMPAGGSAHDIATLEERYGVVLATGSTGSVLHVLDADGATVATRSLPILSYRLCAGHGVVFAMHERSNAVTLSGFDRELSEVSSFDFPYPTAEPEVPRFYAASCAARPNHRAVLALVDVNNARQDVDVVSYGEDGAPAWSHHIVLPGPSYTDPAIWIDEARRELWVVTVNASEGSSNDRYFRATVIALEEP